MTPPIVWNFGGPIAYAHPTGHDNMIVAWDWISGDVFIQTPNGRTRNMFYDVVTAGKFKAYTTQIFDDIFADAEGQG